jgi:hypothetical protein
MQDLRRHRIEETGREKSKPSELVLVVDQLAPTIVLLAMISPLHSTSIKSKSKSWIKYEMVIVINVQQAKIAVNCSQHNLLIGSFRISSSLPFPRLFSVTSN